MYRIPDLLRTAGSFVLIAAACQLASTSGAQPADLPRGFSTDQAKEQLAWEDKMRGIPRPDLLREYMAWLSAEPHALGSPRGKANAEWILNKLRSWGLLASIEEFQVLFPTPRERVLELIEPVKHVARLKEPAVPEDPDSTDAGQLPTYNAYSADGDVTAQVVYVNYGVPDDYEALKKLGVDVRGKVVLARYGASWRGIKPKVAYEHGAIGCLIYSDPKDDGYFRGAVYPEGPYRPEQGVQRGSVIDMPIYPGDPLTPGIGATADAKRLPLKEVPTFTKIPVLPISYGDALPILKNLRGTVVPENWRGALPVTYFTGPGPAVVHLKVTSDWNLHSAYDVICRIEGSTFPEEWIIQGNHHDAWVNGASDPISGLVPLLEEARALGELLKQGWRPRRTIIFAAWDGEEPGLLGSTEWAEAHAAELEDKAVLYLNGDSNGKGWFGASGSHSLERFLHEVARDIADPATGKSVYDALRDRRLETAADDQAKKELRERADLRIGALGSGSDYTVFIDHLGIACLDLRFGGDDGGGVYHSIYDSFYWYTHFSDTTFEYGRALAQLDGTAVMRLADAQVLPFDFTNLADTVGLYVDELDRLNKKKDVKVDVEPLRRAQQGLMQSAQRCEQAYQQAAASGAIFGKGTAFLHELNKLLYQSERVLASSEGLPRRPWFRHQLYAPGFYTGYGVKTIPYVREAIEQQQWEEAAKGIQVVQRRLTSLASHLDSITKMLRQ
ncbi:MAG TPA: M28 family metallopeptidase [Acidobacteriota bacterium]|nr:M28 family metallopeptidase [Acidobacteriota bacterium]